MGVIPEDDEEWWGTGWFEDLTQRPDIEEMEGFNGPQYDEEFAWASEVRIQEDVQPGERSHEWKESKGFVVKEVNENDQTLIWNDSGYYVKYNTATIDLPTAENDGLDEAKYTLPDENQSPNK